MIPLEYQTNLGVQREGKKRFTLFEFIFKDIIIGEFFSHEMIFKQNDMRRIIELKHIFAEKSK